MLALLFLLLLQAAPVERVTVEGVVLKLGTKEFETRGVRVSVTDGATASVNARLQ